MKPDTIMIFAAGHGTRMGGLTKTLPKPLISVAGKPLLDHAIALADAAKITNKLVNTHYLGQMVSDHLQTRPDIVISHEKNEALESAGGMKLALPRLGQNPVFALNSDAMWTGLNPLIELAEKWQPKPMDALLCLVPLGDAVGHKGRGDFNMDQNGLISRFNPDNGPAFVYTGAQILHTKKVKVMPQKRFSFNLVWDQMIAENRLFGCMHQGQWADVGTPQGIPLAEAMLDV